MVRVMKRVSHIILGFICVLIFSLTARASDEDKTTAITAISSVRAALDAGNFDQTVIDGTALGTASGLVLAAEALNAQLLLGLADKKIKTAKRAMKLAKAALALEPQNPDAQFQYAIAYGFYGRHVSSFTAWRKNLPKKIRDEIDKAAKLAPADGRVDALKGAWHLNLLYRAGGWDVKKRYGADEATGLANYQTALKTNADDIIILSSYLMLNYILAPEQRADATQAALKNMLQNLRPKNAVERQIFSQMQGVADGFSNGKSFELAEKFVNQ